MKDPESDENRHSKPPIALGKAHRLRKNALQESDSLALAVHFPTTPTLNHRTCREADPDSRRHYLDLLLEELRLLNLSAFRQPRLTHLWWLGHPSAWLEPAQMTELMFRTGQLLPEGVDHLAAATICMDRPFTSKDTWALIRGLGFTHIVTSMDREPQIEGLARQFGLTAVPNAMQSPMPVARHAPLIGIGLGASTICGPYCITNFSRLDQYRAALDRSEFPSHQAHIDRTTRL